MQVNITDFGAAPESLNNAPAIQKAIDAVRTQGGTVVIPRGTFVSGTLWLYSGITLHLDQGAVLKGSTQMGDYPTTGLNHNELGPVKGLLIADHADDLVIEGDGQIDFSGPSFFDFKHANNPQFEKQVDSLPGNLNDEFAVKIMERPTTMVFLWHCTHLTIRDVHFKDAASWDLVLTDCDDVKIEHISISSTQRLPNDDGIHLGSCHNVIIHGCNIVTGDDCIAITGIADWLGESHDIVIDSCLLSSVSAAVRIGYWRSQVRNVQITNCRIHESGRGILIHANNSGYVKDVMISNISYTAKPRAGAWWGRGEAVFILAVPYDIADQMDKPRTHHDVTPNIQGITIHDLHAVAPTGIVMVGENHNITDVHVHHVDLTIIDNRAEAVLGTHLDLSPVQRHIPSPQDTAYWLYAENVDGAVIEDVTLHNALHAPETELQLRTINDKHFAVAFEEV